MHVFRSKRLKEAKKYRHVLYERQGATVTVMCIAAGGEIPRESHPKQTQIITVVEGTANVYGAGRLQMLHVGDVIVIPKRTTHTIKNTGTAVLRLTSVYC